MHILRKNVKLTVDILACCFARFEFLEPLPAMRNWNFYFVHMDILLWWWSTVLYLHHREGEQAHILQTCRTLWVPILNDTEIWYLELCSHLEWTKWLSLQLYEESRYIWLWQQTFLQQKSLLLSLYWFTGLLRKCLIFSGFCEQSLDLGPSKQQTILLKAWSYSDTNFVRMPRPTWLVLLIGPTLTCFQALLKQQLEDQSISGLIRYKFLKIWWETVKPHCQSCWHKQLQKASHRTIVIMVLIQRLHILSQIIHNCTVQSDTTKLPIPVESSCNLCIHKFYSGTKTFDSPAWWCISWAVCLT